MNKKLFALVVVVIMISLVLSGCTRSATSKSPTNGTATSEIPFPIGTVDTSARVTEIVQQTQNAISTPYVPPVVTPQTGGGQAAQATNTLTLPTSMFVTTTAPTPTRTLVVLPALTRPSTYTLKQGEWPICIARRYNLELASFFAANDLNMNSSPGAGTVLVIPESGTWGAGDRSLKTHPVDYTVGAGETIYSIACEYGDVDPMAIVAANGLTEPYTLTSGQVIYIP